MDEITQQLEDILRVIDDKKNRIRISDFFTNDLEVYSQRMINLEQEISANMISLEEANKKYFLFTDEILQKTEGLENIFTQRLFVRKIKDNFRKLLMDGPIYKSLIVKRAHDKPKGYPGDYQMLELFYDNRAISTGIGFCGDSYILNDDYVKAVRSRKDKMKEILSKFIKQSKLSSLNILNLGCGSCREIKELFFSGFNTDKNITFTLVDQDQEALDFCRKTLNFIPKNITFNFIKENLLNLSQEKYKDTLKEQDMIYAIGVADYLPDIFLGRLIKFCSSLLKPNGEFIFAHKNVKKYKASAPDWFCDWYFLLRNKEDVIGIIKTYLDEKKFNIEVDEEESKHIFFVTINKL